jgi:hypothetical protein
VIADGLADAGDDHWVVVYDEQADHFRLIRLSPIESIRPIFRLRVK